MNHSLVNELTALIVKAVESFARLDGIVTLVDAMHIEQHLDEAHNPTPSPLTTPFLG